MNKLECAECGKSMKAKDAVTTTTGEYWCKPCHKKQGCDHDEIEWRSRVQKTEDGFRYVGRCACGQWFEQVAIFSDEFNEIDGPNE